jgi:hypothetical protein
MRFGQDHAPKADLYLVIIGRATVFSCLERVSQRLTSRSTLPAERVPDIVMASGQHKTAFWTEAMRVMRGMRWAYIRILLSGAPELLSWLNIRTSESIVSEPQHPCILMIVTTPRSEYHVGKGFPHSPASTTLTSNTRFARPLTVALFGVFRPNSTRQSQHICCCCCVVTSHCCLI